jgi:hypothetical protein
MFSKVSLVAAILGTVATVGWVTQGLGLAWYYRLVRLLLISVSDVTNLPSFADLAASPSGWAHHGQGAFQGTTNLATATYVFFLQAKTELATHGAKAYFTRG